MEQMDAQFYGKTTVFCRICGSKRDCYIDKRVFMLANKHGGTPPRPILMGCSHCGRRREYHEARRRYLRMVAKSWCEDGGGVMALIHLKGQ